MKWTKLELFYLRKRAKTMSYAEIGRKLGRSAGSVRVQAIRQGIVGQKSGKHHHRYGKRTYQ